MCCFHIPKVQTELEQVCSLYITHTARPQQAAQAMQWLRNYAILDCS